MRALRNLSIAVIALCALLIIARLIVIKVEPGHVGVVNAEWTSGFVEEDFGPGYHFDIGPFHTWTVFDTTVQTLHMKSALGPGEEGLPALQVKSADGATVTLDISVKFRIAKGKVWSVMKMQGPGQTLDSGYKVRVKDKVRDTFVATLGGIHNEEFYDSARRQEVSKAMEKSLKAALEQINIDLVAILIRDVKFQEEFEARIKEKALAEENIELNVAQTQAEDFKGRTAKIETETKAKIVVIDEEREKEIATMRAENDRKIEAIRADYEKFVTEMQSDADLYAAQKEADGTRLLKTAEADGQALKREALAKAGGANFVAFQLAGELNLGAMSVSTQQVNPLDVAAILELLGAHAPTDQDAAAGSSPDR